MNIKKQFFASILLIFSMSFFCSMHKSTQINWTEKMSRDSISLLVELDKVEKEINTKNPEFYDKEKELKIAQEEFKKEELKNFAQEINETMKEVTFEIEQTDNVEYIISKEFIDYLKEVKKYDNYENLVKYNNIFGTFAKYITTFPEKYESNITDKQKEIFTKGLITFLKIIFKNDKNTLKFIDKNLSKNIIDYKYIKSLMENENPEIKSKANELFILESPTMIVKVKNPKTGLWEEKERPTRKPNTYKLSRQINKNFFDSREIRTRDGIEDMASNINYVSENNVKNKHDITIKLWYPKNLDNNLKNKFVKRALSEILVYKKIFQENLEREKDIVFLPSSAQKTFPQKGVIFSYPHINSAFNSPSGMLCIYRKEESLKTILHEINHDHIFNTYFDDKNITQNHKKLPVKDMANSTDASVEAAANITNIIMTACEISPDNYLQIAPQLLEREKLFAIYQTAKILYLSNFDNFEQFYNPTENGPKIQQENSATEYYILKTVLLQDISGFLKIYKEKDALERQKQLEELMRNNMPKPDLVNKINTIIKAFKDETISTSTDPDNFLFKTGRMTIIEPSLEEKK